MQRRSLLETLQRWPLLFYQQQQLGCGLHYLWFNCTKLASPVQLDGTTVEITSSEGGAALEIKIVNSNIQF